MPPGPSPRHKSNNKNTNDLKTLRNNYKTSLPSLTELFPDWSQEDLLFVMDECQGDLDLAITRISEGHANQWGQVKSKKPKPVVAAPKKPMNRGESSPRGGKFNGRGKSSGAYKSRNGNRSNQQQQQKEEKPETIIPPEEQKPSWASILRGPPKPEEIPVEKEAPAVNVETVIEEIVDQVKEEIVDAIEQNIQLDDKEVVIIENKVEEEKKEEEEEEKVIVVVEEEKEVEAVVDKVEEEEEKEEEKVEEKEQVVEVQAKVHVDATIVEEKELKSEVEEKEQIIAETTPATTSTRKPTVRRLNQVEAVVLPGNQAATLSSVNVQFGSLNLSNGEESVVGTAVVNNTEIIEQPEEVKEPIIEKKQDTEIPKQEEVLVVEPNPSAVVNQPQQPQQLNNNAVNAGGLVGFGNKPAMVPLHQQQQQQETPYMMNPYSASYNHMNTIGNGYNGMIPTEYTMYNNTMDIQPQQQAQQQRMNYYDTSIYGHSPSMGSAHLFTRDKYIPGQMIDSATTATPPQQYNAGYYNPYYYQPPQQPYHTSYQQPQQPSAVLGYQPPYVNKTMYPVYGGAIGKPTSNNNVYEYQPYDNDMLLQQQQQQQQQMNHSMMPLDKQQQQQQQQQYYQQQQAQQQAQVTQQQQQQAQVAQPQTQPQQQLPQQTPQQSQPQQSQPLQKQSNMYNNNSNSSNIQQDGNIHHQQQPMYHYQQQQPYSSYPFNQPPQPYYPQTRQQQQQPYWHQA